MQSPSLQYHSSTNPAHDVLHCAILVAGVQTLPPFSVQSHSVINLQLAISVGSVSPYPQHTPRGVSTHALVGSLAYNCVHEVYSVDGIKVKVSIQLP